MPGKKLTLTEVKRMDAAEAAGRWDEVLTVLAGLSDEGEPKRPGAEPKRGADRLAVAYTEKERERKRKRALQGVGRKLAGVDGKDAA